MRDSNYEKYVIILLEFSISYKVEDWLLIIYWEAVKKRQYMKEWDSFLVIVVKTWKREGSKTREIILTLWCWWKMIWEAKSWVLLGVCEKQHKVHNEP